MDKKPIVLIFVAILFAIFIFWPNLEQGSTLKTQNLKVEPLIKTADLAWQLATTSAAWQNRDAGASVVWQDRVWFMGGVDGEQAIANDVEYWNLPHYNDVWSSSDGANWREETKATKWPPRRSMSVVEWQGKLWLMGGWSPDGGYRSDIWNSVDGITWALATSSAAFPPREGQTVNIFQNKLWLIGGVNFDQRKTYNDVWFSTDALNWTLATSSAPWSDRYDHAVEVFNNKLWLTGGVALGSHGQSDIWSSVNGRDWQLVESSAPWGKRHGFALLTWRDRLWIISGWNTETRKGMNDVWSSADGQIWTKTEAVTTWLGREDHSALIYHDTLWLFAGMDTNWQWQNDVWLAQFSSISAPGE